jgi:hypothetical protein
MGMEIGLVSFIIAIGILIFLVYRERHIIATLLAISSFLGLTYLTRSTGFSCFVNYQICIKFVLNEGITSSHLMGTLVIALGFFDRFARASSKHGYKSNLNATLRCQYGARPFLR